MAFVQATINSTDPLDTEAIGSGADRIRDLAAAVKERLASAFVAPDTDPMVLKAASMPTNIVNLTLSGIIAANSAAIVGAITGASLAISGIATVGSHLDVGGDLTVVGAIDADLDATRLVGDVPDASFPATLPVASAANLTNVPADNLAGTIATARLPASIIVATKVAAPLLGGESGQASVNLADTASAFLEVGASSATWISQTAPAGAGQKQYIKFLHNGTEYKIMATPTA